jgi:opacity protein-like surface antigen
VRQALAILAAFFFLIFSGARQPAQAGLQPKVNFINLAGWSLAGLALSAALNYMYRNSPAQRELNYEENLGPGEWYLAAYSGLSYLPPADWQLQSYPRLYQGRTAQNITYQPGIVGGLKFGRYFDRYPWLGLEVETSFSRQAIHGGQGTISPPVPGGPPKAILGSDRFYIWATQVNLLARCGFLKDKEIPFGRLQPYVGLGPGFEVMYGTYDSAKNLAIEVQGGLRYMLNYNLAIFGEYKFSCQFDVEYENVFLSKGPPSGAMSFDVPRHRFIVGVSYHFKNLYGNY